MRRVTVNGQSYALPFDSLLRSLTESEFADLESDIIAHGVLYAVIVGISPTHGRIIIEGAHRARICEKHGLPCPVSEWGEVADEVSKSRCLALNIKRRHLSAAELVAARAIRVQQVAELRKSGMTYRAIADRVDVSLGQVQRDLEDSGVSPDTDNDEDDDPPRVTGRDGKSYPARRREPSDEEILRDTVPPRNQIAIAEESRLNDLIQALDDAQEAVTALMELNGPRLKRFLKATKRNKVPIKGTEWTALAAMRAAVESVTQPAADKPASTR